jgi:hypothetical protein
MHREQELQSSWDTVLPRDMVCLRNISVNTLHRIDYDATDDDIKTWAATA